MGTHGYRIFKFRGRYWIFYNHWDSYPEGLGKSLAGKIPTDPERYRKWLHDLRDFFAKWDGLLQDLLCIQDEDLTKLRDSRSDITELYQAAFDERLEGGTPNHIFYANGDYSYTYTFDLDLEVFSVDSGAHYRLDSISKSSRWIDALSYGREHDRFAVPQYAADGSIASLTVDTERFTTNALEYSKLLKMRTVTTKGEEHVLPSHTMAYRLRWILFDVFQREYQGNLSVNLLGWTAEDLPFRELAFFILCIAAGGDYLALVDDRRMLTRDDYAGIRVESGSEMALELATSVGTGYHKPGLPLGSAPQETKYWFEGALVSLVPRLDRPGVLEKAIADTIHHGRSECARVSFNAILLSIEHLVFLRSLPDGSVDCTHLMPFVSVPLHLSKNARDRYGDAWVDEFYHAEELKRHPIQSETPPSEETGKHDNGGGRTKQEDEADHQGQKTKSRLAMKATFSALMTFLDATVLETLRPDGAAQQLPTEICEMISPESFEAYANNDD